MSHEVCYHRCPLGNNSFISVFCNKKTVIQGLHNAAIYSYHSLLTSFSKTFEALCTPLCTDNVRHVSKQSVNS